jgi:hypothetical protein
MEHMNTSYVITGLDPVTADRLRAGHGQVYVANSQPGYPCRQCVRLARSAAAKLIGRDPGIQRSCGCHRTAVCWLMRRSGTA